MSQVRVIRTEAERLIRKFHGTYSGNRATGMEENDARQLAIALADAHYQVQRVRPDADKYEVLFR